MKRVIIAILLVAPFALAQDSPPEEERGEQPTVVPAEETAETQAEEKAEVSTEETADTPTETPAPNAKKETEPEQESKDSDNTETSGDGETQVGSPTAADKQPEPASAEASGDSAYKTKILELQGRVNNLKEKIFRTKTRLAILKENVLSKTIAGAEGRLVHRNTMGGSYVLEKIVYSLNGTPIFSRVDLDGGLDEKEEIELFNGPLPAKEHTLSVMMVYRGNGFGVFSYLKGYVYTIRSSHTFTAVEGKRINVTTIAFEKGSLTTDHRDRPDLRFEEVVSDPSRSRVDNQDG